MSLLYVLGQHDALEAVDSQLGVDEAIFGFWRTYMFLLAREDCDYFRHLTNRIESVCWY